jgi:hypothetical protein
MPGAVTGNEISFSIPNMFPLIIFHKKKPGAELNLA